MSQSQLSILKGYPVQVLYKDDRAWALCTNLEAALKTPALLNRIPESVKLIENGTTYLCVSPRELLFTQFAFKTDRQREALIHWALSLEGNKSEDKVLAARMAYQTAIDQGQTEASAIESAISAVIDPYETLRINCSLSPDEQSAISEQVKQLTQILDSVHLANPTIKRVTIAGLLTLSLIEPYLAIELTPALTKEIELNDYLRFAATVKAEKDVKESELPDSVKAVMLGCWTKFDYAPIKPSTPNFVEALNQVARSRKSVKFVPSAILIARNTTRSIGDEFTLKMFRRELAKRWHPDLNNGQAIPELMQPFITGGGWARWDDNAPAHEVLSHYCTFEFVPEFTTPRTERKGAGLALASHLFGTWIEQAYTERERKWLASYRRWRDRVREKS